MPMTAASHAWQLLVEIARETPRPALAELLARPPRRFDPRQLARRAVQSKLSPHLVHALLPFEGRGYFSADTLLQLSRGHLYAKWLPERIVLLQTLYQLKASARGLGAPMVFLRGPHFAERYYLRPEMRVSRDLDVLVPREAVARAGILLQDLGFVHAQPPAFREAKAFYQGQLSWRHVHTGVLVDLNWRLTANAGIGPVEQDIDAVWARVSRDDAGVCWLAPEDELLYLVRHLAHGHDFSQGLLRGCVDIEALLRTQARLDVDYFRRQTTRSESVRAAGLIFHFFLKHYQPEPCVAECARGLLTAPFGSEAGVRLVLKPLARGITGSQARTFARRNIQLFAKLCFLDRLARFRFLLRVLVRPTNEEAILLHFADSTGKCAQWRHMAGSFLVSPGIIAGALTRIGVSLNERLCK